MGVQQLKPPPFHLCQLPLYTETGHCTIHRKLHALHCTLYTIHFSLHTFTESNKLQTVKYTHFYKTR